MTRCAGEAGASGDVVITTRNRPSLTVDAIESVRRQTFTDWRLFVVDDSDDDTADRSAAAAAGDPRVTIIRREDPRGASAARQTGLDHGAAPLVAILDSDDVWLPQKLERQLQTWETERAADPTVGVVFCLHRARNLNGRPRAGVPHERSRRWTPFQLFNTSTALI